MTDERKNIQTTPTRTYCKRRRPLPYFLFAPLLVIGRKYRPKIVQHMLQAIAFSPIPHLLQRKGSPARAALAAGAGHNFLPFPIFPFSSLIIVRTKMTSLETFQSKITQNTSKCYVDCDAVSWFSICRQTKLDSCTILSLILLIFVALCLHKRSRKIYKCKRQPF